MRDKLQVTQILMSHPTEVVLDQLVYRYSPDRYCYCRVKAISITLGMWDKHAGIAEEVLYDYGYGPQDVKILFSRVIETPILWLIYAQQSWYIGLLAEKLSVPEFYDLMIEVIRACPRMPPMYILQAQNLGIDIEEYKAFWERVCKNHQALEKLT